MNNKEVARCILVLNKEEYEKFKNQVAKMREDLSHHEKRLRPEIYLAESLCKDVEEVVSKIIHFYDMVEKYKLSLGVVFEDSMKLKIELKNALWNLKEETNPEELRCLISFFTILDAAEKWKFEH